MRDRALEGAFEIRAYTTASGARIFQIPVQQFPGLWGWVYLVLIEGEETPLRVLIDSGSGFGESNQNLEAGLKAAGELADRRLALEDLTHILITHGHIDHFGGLSYLRPRTGALIGVHELDLRILTHYEERLEVVGRRLAQFLLEAGVDEGEREELLRMYRITKNLYHSIQVDFTYEAAGMRLGPFELLHTPGHCAGHVVIRLEDVLFCGDHVLERTSPHQSPEHLTLSTGLDHYLRSLNELKTWAPDVRLVLGGHEGPVMDLAGRIEAIQRLHFERLDKVLDLLGQPATIAEISRSLFGEVRGYNALLAVEEAGAHVEYLYQRGKVRIVNLHELEQGQGGTALVYQRLD